jgi:uncharacterized membrane protein YkvA (DUF1232 family)
VVRILNVLPFLPLVGRAPMYGRLLLALATDPRVPASRKALLGLAAAYLVSPFDLLPDRIPLLGGLDDLAVMVLAVDVFLEGLPPELIDEKLAELGIPARELEKDLQRVRRMVPGPVRAAAARLPEAIDGVTTFAAERGLDRRLRKMLRNAAGARTARRLEEHPA